MKKKHVLINNDSKPCRNANKQWMIYIIVNVIWHLVMKFYSKVIAVVGLSMSVYLLYRLWDERSRDPPPGAGYRRLIGRRLRNREDTPKVLDIHLRDSQTRKRQGSWELPGICYHLHILQFETMTKCNSYSECEYTQDLILNSIQ